MIKIEKSKVINILIIGVSGVVGGVEMVVKNIYDNISNDIIHFDFLSFSESCAFEDYFISKNSEVYHVISRRKNFIKSYIQLKNFFMKFGNNYDLVWIHQSSASNINVHKLVNIYSNAKIISHSHSSRIECKNFILGIIYRSLDRINKKKFCSLVNYFFACSEAAGIRLYGNHNKSSVIIINNGIDINHYKFKLMGRNLIRENHQLDSKFVIGHIGRFVNVKNHLYPIDIFKEIVILNPESALLLIGEGPTMPDIKEKVNKLGLSNKVFFLGYRNDISNLLSAMDCFILPSYFEGTPVVVIEAIANGLKCLLSSNINDEFGGSNLIRFLDIKNKPKVWAEVALEERDIYDRSIYSDMMRGGKFDIKSAAEIYIQALQIK